MDDAPPDRSPPAGLISSRRNPLVARFRALHGAEARREQRLLLLEGTHLLEEALGLGLRPAEILATPAWLERHGARRSLAGVQLVSEAVLEAIATTRHPDGVVLSLPWPDPASPSRCGFVLALDHLQDPGNLGTLMRTALAAGVEALWLAGGADPWQPKVLRASSGAALALPHWRSDDLAPRLLQARREGAQVVAAVVPGSGAATQPYWQLDWTLPTVLLLGNEAAGLGAELLACCSHRVTIPHSPTVESLNVAVAAAPLLLERWRQQQERMPGIPSSAPP
ncbi:MULTISPECIES: TrmH family RNA methyltransferase [Synechococcales]|uniref:TrmH family RNA methyltransferase n=1 Tax=Synechococcus sp. CS-1324 TaxID=2847980 RepID=UPI00223B09C9|nr:RNA methyltransferase [Synechococcus sp. CS-1324]